MTTRRYSDDEARRILALAAEAEVAAAAEAERAWTLGDVERVGVEAGIAPQAVAAAALALEHQREAPEPGRYLGLPVAVSRAVPLGRRLSDDDWEQLVGRLRETFAVEGRTRVSGARREWRVGNLRVTHEPAGSGALLQMRTRKGDARGFVVLGALLLFAALALAATATMGASEDRAFRAAMITGLVGVITLLVGVLRLPAWARERARQFEALAAYARRIAAP